MWLGSTATAVGGVRAAVCRIKKSEDDMTDAEAGERSKQTRFEVRGMLMSRLQPLNKRE